MTFFRYSIPRRPNTLIYVCVSRVEWSFSGAESRVQLPESCVHCPESSVQISESSVQSPQSSVQHPAHRVQCQESSVQTPASYSCVQKPGLLVCLFITDIILKRKYEIKKISNFDLFNTCPSLIQVSGNRE